MDLSTKAESNVKQSFYELIESETGFGKIGLDGRLGYHDAHVSVAPNYRSWEAISAHGPSKIRLRFDQAVEINGGLDGSTERLFRDRPVVFKVNQWRLGQCLGPWDVTRSIILPPGEHELCVEIDGKANGCHSLWLCKTVDKEIATPENSVFLSVDTRGPQSDYSVVMRKSASKYGIEIVFLDEGETWQGFYHHKIEKMIPILHRYQEAGKHFAFIVDSRDIAFVDPLPFMLGKFNALQEGGIVYNTDGLGYSYPCGQLWYKDAYRRVTGHYQTFLNAGVLAGPIPVFIRAMEICRTIRSDLLQGKPWPGIMEHHYRDHRDWSHNDDQYLYQLCQMYHPELFTPDIERRFCVHLKGYPRKDWRNDFEYRDPCCAGTASILHIPDLAGTAFWKEWVDCEGDLSVLQMRDLEIGYRRPGYGSITIGKSPDSDGKKIDGIVLIPGDETITAHANSILEVVVRNKIDLAGAINETKANKAKNPSASFLVDGESIGTAARAGAATSFIRLHPGKHTLSIQAVGSNRGCHSFWIVRQSVET